MDKIGDVQFRIMCKMWGVDDAVEAARRMDMAPSENQIQEARAFEQAQMKAMGDAAKEWRRWTDE